MNKLIPVFVVIFIVLTACDSAAQTGPPQGALGADEVESAATTEAPTPLPPTATSVAPTATHTPEPPTLTPESPTPTSAPVDVLADISYIDDGTWQHRSTIYLPVGFEEPYPTVVIYHSGAFWFGDEEYLASYEELGRFFAGRGYAVVVPAYRLSDTDPYPAAVEDAFCALAWVHANAAEHGFDSARVAALGLDAGADLAALIGTVDEPELYLESCPHVLPDQPLVQGVVAIGGYYDLPALFIETHAFGQMFQGYISHYLQAEPEEAPERYAGASPITWVDGSEPPFAVIYNQYESHCPARSLAQDFANALRAAAVSVQVTEVTSGFWLMVPFSEGASNVKGGWRPTLDHYGIPQAEAFLAELFGMGE